MCWLNSSDVGFNVAMSDQSYLHKYLFEVFFLPIRQNSLVSMETLFSSLSHTNLLCLSMKFIFKTPFYLAAWNNRWVLCCVGGVLDSSHVGPRSVGIDQRSGD